MRLTSQNYIYVLGYKSYIIIIVSCQTSETDLAAHKTAILPIVTTVKTLGK
jgi:hypothetical protein